MMTWEEVPKKFMGEGIILERDTWRSSISEHFCCLGFVVCIGNGCLICTDITKENHGIPCLGWNVKIESDFE